MSSGLKTSPLPELSEDRVSLIQGLTPEPSPMGAPRLGDRTKGGTGPSGEAAGGLCMVWTLWAGCRGGSERGWQKWESVQRAQSLRKPPLEALPRAALLCLAGCQNGHSPCQWPSCRLDGSSRGHTGASGSRYAHVQSPGGCIAWRCLSTTQG